MESRKIVQMNLLVKQKQDTDVENKHMDAKGGWGGMNGETGIYIYTLV